MSKATFYDKKDLFSTRKNFEHEICKPVFKKRNIGALVKHLNNKSRKQEKLDFFQMLKNNFWENSSAPRCQKTKKVTLRTLKTVAINRKLRRQKREKRCFGKEQRAQKSPIGAISETHRS